ncbi:VOC family protein [Brevibacterium album]|uniref:VOC family protein n=1 Tax=Brevibacterium album TaxID=417948 RepID=UPI0003FECA52|nr:VOC family protein [Brevibacterium album]
MTDTAARTVQITFDAHDPRALALFWCEALGYAVPLPPGVPAASPGGEPHQDPFRAWEEFLARLGVPPEHRNGRAAAEDPAGLGPRLFFQRVPEGKSVKNRVHPDVRAAPGLAGEERMDALEAECARLIAVGARRLERVDPDPPLEAGFIVMADPEGNEFCLD